jgi:hypothetical protein
MLGTAAEAALQARRLQGPEAPRTGKGGSPTPVTWGPKPKHLRDWNTLLHDNCMIHTLVLCPAILQARPKSNANTGKATDSTVAGHQRLAPSQAFLLPSREFACKQSLVPGR